jgi:hypothetical protein
MGSTSVENRRNSDTGLFDAHSESLANFLVPFVRLRARRRRTNGSTFPGGADYFAALVFRLSRKIRHSTRVLQL